MTEEEMSRTIVGFGQNQTGDTGYRAVGSCSLNMKGVYRNVWILHTR